MVETKFVTVSGKRGNFTQNVKSWYEPVKFTCHTRNVVQFRMSLEPNEIFSVMCATILIANTQNFRFAHFPRHCHKN